MRFFSKITEFPGSPFLLLKMLTENKWVPVSKWPIVWLYFFKTFVMFPFSLYERIFLYRKINRTEITETPVFVIGHYRSGTTFLHKTMISDDRYAYFETFDFIFPYCPRLFRPLVKRSLQFFIDTFKVKNPHFNNYIVQLDDPLEEDMITIGALTRSSAFWSEIFPQNALEQFEEQIFFQTEAQRDRWERDYLYCLKKITWRTKGKPLMLKNPPNTGRIQSLLRLFPDAKFLLIHRNPYRVYFSTMNLWKRILEKKYSLHVLTSEQRNEIIFTLYKRLMGQYRDEKDLIPEGNRVEIRYETFVKEPFEEIKRVYAHLGLPGFERAAPAIAAGLQKEKSYQSFKYDLDYDFQAVIYEQLGEFIDRWDYERLQAR